MRPIQKSLLVVYHSLTGGTQQMVDAFCEGARQETDVETRCLRAHQADVQSLLAADGLVFATPENLASMSGQLKDFFDRTYYAALDRLNARPYSIMVCAGNDGQNAVRQIERIATGWRLAQIQPALIVHTQAQTPEQILAPKQLNASQLSQCRELGTLFATGLALSIF